MQSLVSSLWSGSITILVPPAAAAMAPVTPVRIAQLAVAEPTEAVPVALESVAFVSHFLNFVLNS